MSPRFTAILAVYLTVVPPVVADPPTASYIFPAGARRGTAVQVRVGGLNLHSHCGFELLGPGVQADRTLKRTPTLWLEGPILPLPESQQQEDYPKDMAGTVTVAADAPLGVRPGRVWTAQGAASGLAFVVGDLPEVIESESDGPTVTERGALPVTINGRIFPREDVDEWAFDAKRGQVIVAEALAGRINSPLEPHVEIRDTHDNRLAENDPYPGAADARVRFTAPADGAYRVRIHDARFSGGPAFVYRLTVRGDDKPATFVETLVAKTFDPPAEINGRIATPGAIGSWAVALKKGTAYDLDLFAKRIESPLRPVLSVRDAVGRELAKVDSVAQNGVDPTLRFQPPADGVYRVEVAERFKSRGGPAFRYRLTVVPASTKPDFRLLLVADTLALPRSGKAKLKVSIERINGFKEPVDLTVDGLPPGVKATKTTLAPNQNLAEIPLEAGADAAIDAFRATVRGAASVSHAATLPAVKGLPEIDSVLVAVTVPTPFEVKADYVLSQAPRGTVYVKKYRIDRKGFTGPVTVTLADRQARHLQGVTGPTLVVPPEKNEFDYPITLPPWMETGRTCRVCIMAVGEIKDRDGRAHEVSFSSTEQHMQMIAVVEPGRLGLELDRTSVRAETGKSVALPFRVQRGDGLKGAARIEVLPAPGVAADAVTVADGKSEGVLTLRFGAGVRPGTAVVRVTITEQGRPVTAEARVEFVGAE